MKLALSWILYHIGDTAWKLIERFEFLTPLLWRTYQKCLEWSSELDVDCKVWNKVNSEEIDYD